MRHEIPLNNVPHDYVAVLDSFVKKLAEQQQQNIQAILLTGSYARGDAGPSSDLDIWCLFQEIDHNVLSSVGKVARSLPVQYDNLEVNAQCLTKAEFEYGNFAKFISPPVIYLESVLLYGDYSTQKPSAGEIEKNYKEILAEVLLSVRHYICVDEPKENLTHRKVSTFILKPLMFALRLERFAYTGSYPLSTNELLHACDPHITVLIDWFLDADLLQRCIAENHYLVLETMSDLIENLL